MCTVECFDTVMCYVCSRRQVIDIGTSYIYYVCFTLLTIQCTHTHAHAHYPRCSIQYEINKTNYFYKIHQFDESGPLLGRVGVINSWVRVFVRQVKLCVYVFRKWRLRGRPPVCALAVRAPRHVWQICEPDERWHCQRCGWQLPMPVRFGIHILLKWKTSPHWDASLSLCATRCSHSPELFK